MKSFSMRTTKSVTHATVFLGRNNNSNHHRDKEFSSQQGHSRKIVILILLDILGNFGDIPSHIGNILGDRLLQNITCQATVDRKAPSKRRRPSFIRDSKDNHHAGSIFRPNTK